MLNMKKLLTKILDRDVYSTSEKRVGTWIDGKPLYRMVMVSDNVSANIVIPNLPNNILITNIYGIWHEGTDWAHTFRARTDAASYSCVIDNINIPSKTVGIVRGASVGTLTKVILYIEYTKTTD